MPSPHRRTLAALAAGVAVAGTAMVGYTVLVERNAFVVRRHQVAALAPGSHPLRVLHLADLHISARQRRKVAFVRRLADLRPDLVVNTGDSVTFANSVPAALAALDPLLDVPGLFVMGNNDYHAPVPKNPMSYLDVHRERRRGPELPWRRLRDAFRGRGWLDLDNVRTATTVAGLRLEVAGVDDAQVGLDRPDEIGGPCDATADLRLGIAHEPQPDLLDAFARDGFDLVLCGHTHGGQVRLPFVGAVVTNCDIDRGHARGLFRWPGPTGDTWVHVSPGLGTSPYAPVRFLCRPEVTLLTLVARRTDRPSTGDGYTGPASGM